jgi:hypothetical protein
MLFRKSLMKIFSIILILSPLIAIGSNPVAKSGDANRNFSNEKQDFSPLEAFQSDKFSASNFLPSLVGLAADTSDFDSDGIHDHDELLFAQWYVPRLIFDEDESHSLISTMLPLFQVTPVWVAGPKSNERYIKQIIITYVFLYKNDKGADINGCYGIVSGLWDALDLFALFPQISQKDILSIKTGHCGDTETFEMYLDYSLANKNWNPVYVKIHRHGETKGPYTWQSLDRTTIAAGKSGCQANFGNCYHPTIYVSQNKHAMYTALTGAGIGCETVGSKKISKWGIGCTISWEDCDSSNSDDKIIPSILDAQNVGETGHYRFTQVTSTKVKNSDQYPGEWIWPDTSNASNTHDDVFCGGFTVSSCGSTGCAGSLSGKWVKFDFTAFNKIVSYRSIM